MRTWGRVPNGSGGLQWVEVSTTANGDNSAVWLTTLIQTLKLNLGESPFHADYGIPAQQSVMTQVFPDFYVARTQQQFAPYFASLQISRVPGSIPPVYNVNVLTKTGANIIVQVPT